MSDLMFDELDEVHVRNYAEVLEQRQNDEGVDTATSFAQNRVENFVLDLYKLNKKPILMRQKHIELLKRSLTHLSQPYDHLDCSRSWLCYWILHSLEILGERLDDDDYSKIATFLAKCQSPEGGFGGGPGQYPHLASTYAAVNALCTIGTYQAYQVINRERLKRFLSSLRQEDGSFSLHADGEVDIRGVYCAVAVAKLTNVYTPEMFKGTANWVAECQTWEGGFGGCPGMEAHGGYSFCGVAALILLEKYNYCHSKSLLRWIVNRQMRLEGGFQGRPNKLVDSCYSFWQCGAFPLINGTLRLQGKEFNSKYWLFDQEALQEYLLICCQHPHGGFLDRPDCYPDLYHTCYALSGLSVAQNSPWSVVIGPRTTNLVNIIHPVYNLVMPCANKALEYFDSLQIPD
ncbi:protein farnesyltransferase subunit beta-like [Hylaeus volcanicus]|uniref:protein farnesyltransferase subunit beta-like n=1 Tax=Hylaeus volcanicus TaxID=313075 RepID=UPI0023B86D6E|nr:protein farnesyltransferase subunit beta-like [Hylaeus volcanicus]XP_053976994.1 protein farnesyltransferase subunit beta-like [Hylaeus volcanicus]